MSVTEHVVTVSRTARYYQLGTLGPETKHLWFVCHGYGHLARYFISNFEILDDGNTVVIAPEGLSRFYLNGFSGRVGATWMTKEGREDEINDYVRYLDAVHDAVFETYFDSNISVTVLGFSQGAATAARWVDLGKLRADRLILWAGLIPHEFDSAEALKKLAGHDLVLVTGSQDEFATEDRIRAQRDLLDKCKVSFTFHQFDGGHELDSNLLKKLSTKA